MLRQVSHVKPAGVVAELASIEDPLHEFGTRIEIALDSGARNAETKYETASNQPLQRGPRQIVQRAKLDGA